MTRQKLASILGALLGLATTLGCSGGRSDIISTASIPGAGTEDPPESPDQTPQLIESTSSSAIDAQLLLARLASQVVTGKPEFDQEHGLEVIRDDQRFTEVLAAIGSEANGGTIAIDGKAWHPSIDFNEYVLAWVYLGYYAACRDRITAVAAREAIDRVMVEVTIGAPAGCTWIDAQCYPYGFVQLPRRELPYVLYEKDSLPVCE